MANLTSKELSSLEDQLGAELLLVKKYKSYASLHLGPPDQKRSMNRLRESIRITLTV